VRARAKLVQESNGIWYAKYLNPDNRWTKRSQYVTKKSVARIKFGSLSRSSTRLMRATSRPGTDSFGAEQYGVTWRRINRLLEDGFTKAELARRLGYKRPAFSSSPIESLPDARRE
jgi:hypothetical protein